ncbi:hypothetical protein ACFFMN_23585 [Planobispora siamensis]|uniref:Uncharacterized protein n=1 Tax=Planobispora siamensis TaxID=936338 RepID=A0A8J3SJB3_9ACTN|nr:hypothetical protein [Planobispora siamensis]GIH95347.1 hypothetical protein Psi01_59770 [Planobispora siamensis]
MGNQIIQQPNGTFAIFSSEYGRIVVWDASEDEIVEWFAGRAAETARRNARETIAHVAAGRPRRAYYQFAMDWQEALTEDRRNGGQAWKGPRHGETSSGTCHPDPLTKRPK